MKLVTLEGYDNNVTFNQGDQSNDDIDSLLGEFDDELLGFGKSFKKAIKKAVKKAAPIAVKAALPPGTQKILKSKIGKAVIKRATPIVKRTVKTAMKSAKIAVPIVANSLGIPPAATAAAMKAVSDLSRDGKLDMATLKDVAENFGVPADKLTIATEMIKSGDGDERQQKIDELQKSDPEGARKAQELSDQMSYTEQSLTQKAGERITEKLAITEAFNNGYAAKLFRAGRIR